MSYVVAIRDNKTGEVRVTEHGETWDPSYVTLWNDGNYGCDCNRGLFFYGRNGIDVDCGETRFTCLYAVTSDGERIELDTDRNDGVGDRSTLRSRWAGFDPR